MALKSGDVDESPLTQLVKLFAKNMLPGTVTHSCSNSQAMSRLYSLQSWLSECRVCLTTGAVYR